MHRSFNDSCFEHEKGYLLKRVLEHQVKLETMVGEIQTCLKMVDVYLALGSVCGSFGIFVSSSYFFDPEVCFSIVLFFNLFFLEFVATYFYYFTKYCNF